MTFSDTHQGWIFSCYDLAWARSAVREAPKLSLSRGSAFPPGLRHPVLLFLPSSSSSYLLAVLVAYELLPKRSMSSDS